jgi:hypothetical protein
MRRIAIACGLLLMVSAIVAAFAQGQNGAVTFTTTPPAPQAWALKKGVAITPASRSVTITYYTGGPCFQDAGVDVQQSAGAVTITKLSSSIAGTIEGSYGIAVPSCPTPAPAERIVGLDAPLGSRVILDGSTSPPTQRYPVPATPAPDSIADAYARLHRKGLPITFDRAFALTSESRYTTTVTSMSRARHHGHRVLEAHITQVAAPAPDRSVGNGDPDPVPDFRGRTLGTAVRWADARDIIWSAGTPPRIVRSRRPTLLANYEVTKQKPVPGAGLRPSGYQPLVLKVRTR